MPRVSVSSSLPSYCSIDGISLHGAQEALSERFGRPRVSIDYSALIETLNSLRRESGWQPVATTTMHLSADPASEGQQRFQSMLRHIPIELDVVHYRDAFVSLPPGRSPSDTDYKPIGSLSSRIAYVIGLMARFPEPQMLVISHAFELCGPLVDLARRVPRGRVGLGYFSSLLDYRWKLAGLLDGRLQGVTFFDLEPAGERLVGIDLSGQPASSNDIRGGLSQF